MLPIASCHVIDPQNVGDLLSCPANYFSFPTAVERVDIRQIQPESIAQHHLIVGGGGLLFPRFLENLAQLANTPERGKLIAWGIGQQVYDHSRPEAIQSFDYGKYLDSFDLAGIRDFGSPYAWVPCVSCMHPSFDQKRDIQHEFVVFSHKKFQLKIGSFPTMTNEVSDFDTVLDFLASGETILTSSYHGAYWGTLLGRKVLAFPFSSKFYTLKHRPGLYPLAHWRQNVTQLKLFDRVVYEFGDKNQYSCPTKGWQEAARQCVAYPDCLEENRARNQEYYAEVMQRLME